MEQARGPTGRSWAEFGHHRHVCALVESAAAGVDLVAPLVVDGLQSGTRIVQIDGLGASDSLLNRSGAGGVDLAHRRFVGQLAHCIAPEEPPGSGFDPTTRLAFLRAVLDEGIALGFPTTKLIVGMEGAVDDETAGALLAYESALDELVKETGAVSICMYDLSRHKARTIAEIVSVHSAALVGGVLRTMRPPARESARERLLSAASRLFHENGIQATGVDAVIAEAEVAKATFYRHFPSKDDLVVACLRDPRTWWLDRVRADVETHAPGGSEAIPVFFEALARWLESENYRGCPYLNTAIEITDPTHPARAAVVDFLQAVEDFLTEVVAAAGYREPRAIAARLQALAAGSISLSVARRNDRAVMAARDAANAVLAEAERD